MPEAFILSAVLGRAALISGSRELPLPVRLSQAGDLHAKDVLDEALRQAGISLTRLEMVAWGGELDQFDDLSLVVRVQRAGASGLQAVFLAAQAVAAGDMDVVAAGGSGWAEQASNRPGFSAVRASQGDGSAALVLASTRAVGRYNLSPAGRLAARVVLRPDPSNPQLSAQQVVWAAVRRASLELDEIEAIAISDAGDNLPSPWAEALGVAEEKIFSADGERMGKAEGAAAVIYLLRHLQQTGQRYGLLLYWPGGGPMMASVIERV